MNWDGGRLWRDWEHKYFHFTPHHDRDYIKESSSIASKNFKTEDILERIWNIAEGTDKMVYKLKGDFSQLSLTVVSHSASIKKLDTQIGKIYICLNRKPRGDLLSNKVANPNHTAQVSKIVTRSEKIMEEHLK